MSNVVLFSIVCGVLLGLVSPVRGTEIAPTAQERANAFAAQFLTAGSRPPLSCQVDGQPFQQRVETWASHYQVEPGAGRTKHLLRWKDPETGLTLRCHGFQYHQFPTIEWVGVFQNEGDGLSPLIEDVRVLDDVFRVDREPGSQPVTLRHLRGSQGKHSGLELREVGMNSGDRLTLRSLGHPTIDEQGHSSGDFALPYFNLKLSRAGGVILGLGWPGQWTATFARVADDELRVAAGQRASHFRLKPGETFRLPRVAIQFYEGDWIDGQNVWRRWMRYHNSPRVHGRLPQPRIAAANPPDAPTMDAASQRAGIDRYLAADLQLDLWCIGAGWYPHPGVASSTGTWQVDQERFPEGLRPLTDHARRHRMRTMVWFAPERVVAETELGRDHPDWLLGLPAAHGPAEAPGDDWQLFDLGRAEAQAWLLDRMGQLVELEGIDVFRHDLPGAPWDLWPADDEPDRIGTTENRHVSGCLRFWDELRRRHPNLVIDAGGAPTPPALTSKRSAVPSRRYVARSAWIRHDSRPNRTASPAGYPITAPVWAGINPATSTPFVASWRPIRSSILTCEMQCTTPNCCSGWSPNGVRFLRCSCRTTTPSRPAA